MRELAAISELVGKAGSYAHLDFSIDTTDPRARRADRQGHRARRPRSRPSSCSSSSSGRRSTDEQADELLEHPGLDFARHHLRTARRYRPHLLSEPEEKLMAEKAPDRRAAPGRGCSPS